MKLEQLTLRNFMRYENEVVNFEDGLTALVGLNGSGKSTLFDGVLFSLYGDTRTSLDRVPNRDHPLAETEVELEFSHNGEKYTINRKLCARKSEESPLRTRVRLEVTGSTNLTLSKSTDVEKHLAEVFGVSKSNFKRSVFAEQGELAVFSDSSPADRRKMVREILGLSKAEKLAEGARSMARTSKAIYESLAEGEEEAKDKATEMKGEIEALTHKLGEEKKSVAETTVVFDGLREKEKDLKKALRGKKRIYEKYVSLDRTLQHLEGEVHTLWSDIRNKRDVVSTDLPAAEKKNSQYEELTKKKDTLLGAKANHKVKGATEKRLTALEKQTKKKEKEIQEIEALGLMDVVDDMVNTFNDLEGCNDGLDGEREELTLFISIKEARIEEVEKKIDEVHFSINVIEECGEGEATCPTCLMILTENRRTDIVEQFNLQIEQLADEMCDLNKEICGCRRKLGIIEEDYDKNSVMMKLYSDEVEVNRMKLAVLEEKKKEVESKRVEAEKMAEEIDAMVDEWDEDEFVQVRDELKALEPAHKSYVQLFGLKKEIASLEKTLEIKVQERNSTDEELQALEIDEEEMEAITTEIDSVREEIDTTNEILKEKVETSNKTALSLERKQSEHSGIVERLEALEQARNEYKRLEFFASLAGDFLIYLSGIIVPHVNVRASRYMSLFTDGAYNTLRLYDGYENGDSKYEIQLLVGGEYRSLAEHSGGEKDLANLSVRLSLSEILAAQSGGRLEFVCLDEVVSSQDTSRRDLLVRGLLSLGRHGSEKGIGLNQILMVTHDELLANIEKKIHVVQGKGQTSHIVRED